MFKGSVSNDMILLNNSNTNNSSNVLGGAGGSSSVALEEEIEEIVNTNVSRTAKRVRVYSASTTTFSSSPSTETSSLNSSGGITSSNRASDNEGETYNLSDGLFAHNSNNIRYNNNNNNSTKKQMNVKRILKFIDLPDDIILYIFKQLDYKSLVRVSQISNFFQSISSNHDLWKALFYLKWGPLFPLVPVCTLKCCHHYFSSPYQNLEPINQLFSLQFYKSLYLPREILHNILESYTFKHLYKFRDQLFSYYHPLLMNGLDLLKSTVDPAQNHKWTKIDDPILSTSINKVTQSVVEKAILPNQNVTQLVVGPGGDAQPNTAQSCTHAIRVTKVIPTRILKELLTLVTDYEKIPLWDVTIRHCTGMIIKAPNNNNSIHHHQATAKYNIIDEDGNMVESQLNRAEGINTSDEEDSVYPAVEIDKDSCKKVDLLHKQIIGNLYMSYVRTIFTQSKYNEKFIDVTINNFKNIEDANNIINLAPPNAITNNFSFNQQQQHQQQDILNFNSNMNNIMYNNEVCYFLPNKSKMYNNIKTGFMELKRKRGDDDEYHTSRSPPNNNNNNSNNNNNNNYNNNSNNNSNNNAVPSIKINNSQDKLPNQTLNNITNNKPTEEYLLKQPIYVVQQAIPFKIGSSKSPENPNNFKLDCFGSGFIFEPLNETGKETKLTYVLQLGKQDWMHDIYELVDEMAVSRNTSINSLISHAYQLNKKKNSM